jgi:signal transduction histidine kinase
MLPKLKLRILHKGLLLLLIPFALQIVLFAQLFSLASKSEALSVEVDKLAVKQAVISALAGSLVSVIQRMLGLTIGHTGTVQNTEEAIEKLHARSAEARQILESSGRKDVFDSKLVNLIEDVQKDQIEMLALLRNYQKEKANSEDRPLEAIADLRELKNRWFKFGRSMVLLKQMMDEQVPVIQKRITENQAQREKIKPMLLFGIASEFGLTILLILLFLKDITGRLQVLVGNAYRIPSGKPLSANVSGTDELAYLDTVLHSASNQLREASEYRKSLMQMVAHDLRSPLISMKLALELILAPQDESTRVNRVMSVTRNVGRLILLIDDLLTIEKLESGKMDLSLDAVDIGKMVDEAFETLASHAQSKSITLKNEVRGVVIAADPDRLMQVIANLVSNAIKYTRKNTAVVVSAEVESAAIKVSITDEGEGISTDKQGKLFEKFYRTDPDAAEQGFGLGLAICKLIVDAHGGKIGVVSSEGKGSMFWFTIPVDREE